MEGGGGGRWAEKNLGMASYSGTAKKDLGGCSFDMPRLVDEAVFMGSIYNLIQTTVIQMGKFQLMRRVWK
jgi:hypothetical protein